MVLEYFEQHPIYDDLLKVLDIGPIGAPRRNIVRLAGRKISVVYREATVAILLDLLQQGLPVIVFVDTGELPYWSSASNHAVVVVGADAERLLVNDPAYTEAPIAISTGDFELAWLNGDYMCAVISTI
jgi:ABC-type bacteriocin/lantibiotic exporter with double-glycine peptidase domain